MFMIDFMGLKTKIKNVQKKNKAQKIRGEKRIPST
jgi:hypothetical protein